MRTAHANTTTNSRSVTRMMTGSTGLTSSKTRYSLHTATVVIAFSAMPTRSSERRPTGSARMNRKSVAQRQPNPRKVQKNHTRVGSGSRVQLLAQLPTPKIWWVTLLIRGMAVDTKLAIAAKSNHTLIARTVGSGLGRGNTLMRTGMGVTRFSCTRRFRRAMSGMLAPSRRCLVGCASSAGTHHAPSRCASRSIGDGAPFGVDDLEHVLDDLALGEPPTTQSRRGGVLGREPRGCCGHRGGVLLAEGILVEAGAHADPHQGTFNGERVGVPAEHGQLAGDHLERRPDLRPVAHVEPVAQQVGGAHQDPG